MLSKDKDINGSKVLYLYPEVYFVCRKSAVTLTFCDVNSMHIFK